MATPNNTPANVPAALDRLHDGDAIERRLHALKNETFRALDAARNILDDTEPARIKALGAGAVSTYNTQVAAIKTGLAAVLTAINVIDALA